jgi:hypothetical protein
MADGVARRRAATAAFTNFGHGAFLLVAFLAIQNGVNCIMVFTKTARRSWTGCLQDLGIGGIQRDFYGRHEAASGNCRNP